MANFYQKIPVTIFAALAMVATACSDDDDKAVPPPLSSTGCALLLQVATETNHLRPNDGLFRPCKGR